MAQQRCRLRPEAECPAFPRALNAIVAASPARSPVGLLGHAHEGRLQRSTEHLEVARRRVCGHVERATEAHQDARRRKRELHRVPRAQRDPAARAQPHRLRALILEDLEQFPDSSISEIQRRIGPEIPSRSIKRALDRLLIEGESFRGAAMATLARAEGALRRSPAATTPTSRSRRPRRARPARCPPRRTQQARPSGRP